MYPNVTDVQKDANCHYQIGNFPLPLSEFDSKITIVHIPEIIYIEASRMTVSFIDKCNGTILNKHWIDIVRSKILFTIILDIGVLREIPIQCHRHFCIHCKVMV